MRTELPEDLRRDWVAAVMAMPDRGPAPPSASRPPDARGIAPARHEDYLDVIAVVEENLARRRNRGT